MSPSYLAGFPEAVGGRYKRDKGQLRRNPARHWVGLDRVVVDASASIVHLSHGGTMGMINRSYTSPRQQQQQRKHRACRAKEQHARVSFVFRLDKATYLTEQVASVSTHTQHIPLIILAEGALL